jgi:hypothetical protein
MAITPISQWKQEQHKGIKNTTTKKSAMLKKKKQNFVNTNLTPCESPTKHRSPMYEVKRREGATGGPAQTAADSLEQEKNMPQHR